MVLIVKRTVILTSQLTIPAMSLGRKYVIKIFMVLIVIYIVSCSFYQISAVSWSYLTVFNRLLVLEMTPNPES